MMPDKAPSSAASRMPEHTRVEITFIPGQFEQWLAFGNPISDEKIDAEHRCLTFTPNSFFALARSSTTAFGTIVARLDVLRAVSPGQPFVTVPYVRPGGEVLLRLDGRPKVERALQLIQAIRAIGIDPADAAPDYWLHVGNRLAADQPPRCYSRARHAIWMLRRRVFT
jgi:hypothetical protein